MSLEDLDCFTVLGRIYVEQFYVSRDMEINWKLVNPSLPRKQMVITQGCGVRKYCPNQIGICWGSTLHYPTVFIT